MVNWNNTGESIRERRDLEKYKRMENREVERRGIDMIEY
jgi:hypothetical protein